MIGYHPDDQALLYASYSVAYKSGTYNIVNLFSAPAYLPPERVGSIELGAKLENERHTLRASAAVFDYEIRNLQSGFVSLFSAGTVNFVSVPKARSRGGELEATWLALTQRHPLAFSLSAAYVDAIYTDYPHGQGFRETTGLYDGDIDLSGHRMVFSPTWSGTISATQGFAVDRGTYEVAIYEYLNAGYYTDANNQVALVQSYEVLI